MAARAGGTNVLRPLTTEQAPRRTTHAESRQIQRSQSPKTLRLCAHYTPGLMIAENCTSSRPHPDATSNVLGRPGLHAFQSSRIWVNRTRTPSSSSRGTGRGRSVAPRASSFSSSASSSAAAVSFSALEEEFSSGGSVAQGLFGRYRRVVQGGYKDHLKDFARAGIIVYALGWTEEGLRREMSLELLVDNPDQTSPVPFLTDPAVGTNSSDSTVRDSSSNTDASASTSNTNASASTSSTSHSPSSTSFGVSANSSSTDSGYPGGTNEEDSLSDFFPTRGPSPQTQAQSPSKSQQQPKSQPLSQSQSQLQSSDEQATKHLLPSIDASLPASITPSTPQPLPSAPLLDSSEAEPRRVIHEDGSVSVSSAAASGLGAEVPRVPPAGLDSANSADLGSGREASRDSVPSKRSEGYPGGVTSGSSPGKPEAQVLEGNSALPSAGANKQELEECLLWLSLIFVTLRCLPPQVVRRWSDVAPVSTDFLLQWRGFCSILTNAYYTQGMAWYSIRRLQMEQLAVMGEAEPSALVADRMRLIFTTLEAVDPRWGGLKDYPTL